MTIKRLIKILSIPILMAVIWLATKPIHAEIIYDEEEYEYSTKSWGGQYPILIFHIESEDMYFTLEELFEELEYGINYHSVWNFNIPVFFDNEGEGGQVNKLIYNGTAKTIEITGPAEYYLFTQQDVFDGTYSFDAMYIYALKDAYSLGYEEGYQFAKDKFEQIGFDKGYEKGTETAVTNQVMHFFESIMNWIGSIFLLEILPGVRIGYFVMIPITFGLFNWFMRIMK